MVNVAPPLNPGEARREEEPDAIFMLPDDGLSDKAEPRVDDTYLDDIRNEFMSMISDEMGVRLVNLFFRFVYPYFPVLSRTQILSNDEGIISVLKSLPLSLLAAVYAASLPFLLYDDVLATTIIHSPPAAVHLYRISWLAIQQEIHAPRLATFQACLLILQRPPTNRYVMDTPYRWSLVAWAVSLAHNLGLQKSCSGWGGLPTWEKRLRGRLWWCIYVIDKFFYLGAGMPSHIKNEEFDVVPPTLSENVASPQSSDERNLDPALVDRDQMTSVNSHFLHLVNLTIIVSDITDAFYTLRAASLTSKNFQLSLELAKPLRSRLRSWKDSFAASPCSDHLHNPKSTAIELDGNASLGLAYIIATMTLFRALLRAIENQQHLAKGEENSMQSGRVAVLAGAKECGKEAIEFVEQLRRGGGDVWDAFWHSWSRANFAMASSFLMRLLINATSTTEKREITTLTLRWRRVLRLGSGNAGNGMMNLALLRLEGSLREFEGDLIGVEVEGS